MQSNIHFNNSPIERIFTEPDIVLRDVKSFWKNEIPYRKATEWAPPTYPIHFEEFQRAVKKLAHLPLKERKKKEIFRFSNMILEAASDLQKKGAGSHLFLSA